LQQKLPLTGVTEGTAFISVANLDVDGRQIALPEGIKPIEYSGQQHVNGGLLLRFGGRHPDPVPEGKNMFYGISVSFDNLNPIILPREFSSRSKIKVLNMTSAYAVFNRIPISVEKVTAPFTPLKTSSFFNLDYWFRRLGISKSRSFIRN
jgi:hypothetical protein